MARDPAQCRPAAVDAAEERRTHMFGRKKQEEPLPRMLGLRIVLWVAAAGAVAFGVWGFLPLKTMNSLAGAWGGLMGDEIELSGSPLLIYVARILLMPGLVLGLFLAIAALNPVRYAVIVTLTTVLLGAWVVFVPVAGLMTGVPFRWYAWDFVPSLIGFVLLLVFRPKGLGAANQ